MYKQLKKMRREEGFTLIELLIVIVILGVLAAIVVFSVQGITDRGASAACQSNTATFNTAAEAFYANTPAGSTPTYPASWADLVPKYLHSQFTTPAVTTWGTATAAPVLAACP